MKRSAALTPLSRDHQHALDAALRLRRADDASLASAIDRFTTFFEREGRHHFEVEERLLVPALPADDAEWSPAVKRVLEDHAAIRHAASLLSAGAGDLDLARGVGERLDAHVRFEERILFGILERRLPTSGLEQLGRTITAAEATGH